MSEVQDLRYRVHANPEKRFFINMLVKDIELLPAILDLVDNSVDGARRLRGKGPYDDLHVDLKVSEHEFRISDNCGGIDLDTARNYAFRFGRPQEFVGTAGSVGEFGVGMKRALFKLGKGFVIDSRGQSTRFVLDVNVDEWAREPGSDWSFTLSEIDEDYHPEGRDGVGTDILVGPLHESVTEDFSSSQTLASLKYQLRLRHREAMSQGLRITLNDDPIIPFTPQLMTGYGVVPIFRSFHIMQGEEVVNVRLYAGVRLTEREAATVDDDQAELFRTERDAGWYVFCNNRLLIAADRSSLTGWGNGQPVYHPQYRQFRGYVFLDAVASELLPWNTTKTGIDQDSRIWRRVFSEMLQAGQEVVTMLNKIKAERQVSESDGERPISVALSKATAAPLAEIRASDKLSYPQPPKPAAKPAVRKIQYSVELDRFEQVTAVLGTSSVAEVGRKTFDFFYRYQVGDEG
ncbi:ATP-binding protein [Nonomuraea sp. NPDC050404]|uniref:ATP-binding protein n=1 Tax=Nonomuraea sp. NPDC050404 TaxID=3155783 RepID=UPI0033FD3E08